MAATNNAVKWIESSKGRPMLVVSTTCSTITVKANNRELPIGCEFNVVVRLKATLNQSKLFYP
jgi:hypothetical protein